nr:SLC13 family permease [uncultured Schaedlerella sp.]
MPALAFIGVSTVTAALLVATGTFTISEMGEFIQAGVAGVHSTAALFIFSVLFFGIMTDAGMFDRIINALMKKVGSNVVGVAMMTCIIAMIGHLDGGGASTFLITIPPMLPVYKRLNMRPTTLLLICVTAMGVMNLLPWGGPTMRSATVLGIEPNELWMKILPRRLYHKDRRKPFWTFTISFEEAQAFRKASGGYLRKNQWEDLTVDVYI